MVIASLHRGASPGGVIGGPNGIHDPFLGVVNRHEKFIDDIIGKPLNPELCRIARRKGPLLLPMTTACDGIPEVFIDEMSANFLRHGNPVQVANVPSDGLVQVFIGDNINDGEFIGIGHIDDDGLVAPKRIVVLDEFLKTL